MNQLDPANFEHVFWPLADITKKREQYKIDKNLQYLQVAPLETLKKIFIQYRFYTHYYIADMANLVAKLPFGELKSILAEILHEELGNGDHTKAHPRLYDDFLLSVGIHENELHQADDFCIKSLESISHSLQQKSWGYAVGLRGMGGECLCQIYLETMHQYFSKNPNIIAIKDQIAWHFWDIHIGEIDLHHQDIVRNAINRLVKAQPHIADDLMNGYVESITAWDHFWQRIFEAAHAKAA